MNFDRWLFVRFAIPTAAAFGLAACSSQASDGSSADAVAGTGSGGDSSAGGASATATGGSSAASGGAASGSGDPDVVVGTFQIKLTPATGQGGAATAVVGKIYDGPSPSTVVWEKPQVDGDCTLTTPRVPFCSTPCGGSAACVEDDTCLAYPTAHEVGAVTVDGLRSTGGATTFTMTPIANAYQPPAGTALAYPPFDEGDPVTVTAAGGYFPGFTLKSTGVAPLELTSTKIVLKSGSPLALSWTKGSAEKATIHVKLDISHHGGTKGQIECDTEDTGSLAISAALVTKLIGLGVAGYPSVIVTRHAVGSAVIAAGRVDLEVASVVEQIIQVEGLVSCAEDGDCAAGETCQADLTCSSKK